MNSPLSPDHEEQSMTTTLNSERTVVAVGSDVTRFAIGDELEAVRARGKSVILVEDAS
jgi:hypothetical protein